MKRRTKTQKLFSFLLLGSVTRALIGQPSITRQPIDFSVSLGANVTNSVSVAMPPLHYQWLFNDSELAGATNRSLLLTNIQVIHAGNYSVLVTDASGSVTSRVAKLDVDPTFMKITTGSIVSSKSGGIGVSWVDVNADGNLDLFLSNSFTTDDLFLNDGNGRFTPSTPAQSGGIVQNISSGDVSWADYDNDGLPDICIAPWQKPGRLYHNQGNASFAEVTSFPRIPGTAYPTGPAWGDYDNDGYLDLFVGNGWFYGPVQSWLLHNNRDGTFTRITNSAVGAIISDLGFSGRCTWVDYDNDGDLDLFQTNVTGKNALYRNEGNGTFTKITNSAIALVSNCYSAAWGDYDNDGNLDVFLQVLGYPPSVTGPQKNRLFHNQGDGSFLEVSSTVATKEALRSLHAAWADYDNDGFLDLFVATDGNNRLYHNNGDGTFSQVTTGSVVNDGGQSWDIAWGDYDNDGFPDLVVANGAGNLPESAFLYRNMGNSNHWLKVTLTGTVSNRSAIGAKVRVKATINGKTFWQMREIGAPTDPGDQRANFGLGNATIADAIRIEWPSGIVQELRDVAANQIMAVTEPAKLEPRVARKNSSVELQVKSWKGLVYDIESSSDLRLWTHVATQTNENGTLSFPDPVANGVIRRFYRVVGR